MWIIAEWMSAYNPIVKIENGRQVLRYVRMLTSDSKMESQNAYVASAKGYFGTGECVICVHERDMILFKTDDIDPIFNEILAAFDYYNDWRDSSREIIDEGCSLQDIIDKSECVFKEPIFVLDTGYTATAAGKNYGAEKIEQIWAHIQGQKSVPVEKIKELMPILTSGRGKTPIVTDDHIFPYCSVIRNIYSYKKHKGSVSIIAINNPNSQARVQLFNELADIVEYWLRHNEDQNDFIDEMSIFQDLIVGNYVPPGKLDYKMELMGWQNEDEKILVKIKSNEDTEEMTSAMLAGIRQNFCGCCDFEYNCCIIMILNLRQCPLRDAVKNLSAYLCRANAYAGLSYIFNDLSNLRQYNRQADIALQYGDKQSGTINHCKDYALSYAISLINKETAGDIAHPGLGKLLEYDKMHSGQMYDTLRSYLMNERNQSVTAAEFGIHRNSLVYRIQKIEEIIEENLDNKDIRMYLILSFLLRDNNL